MTTPLVITRLPKPERTALRTLARDARDLIAAVADDMDAIGHEDSRLTHAGELLAKLQEALR